MRPVSFSGRLLIRSHALPAPAPACSANRTSAVVARTNNCSLKPKSRFSWGKPARGARQCIPWCVQHSRTY